jgi:hypothetical protein
MKTFPRFAGSFALWSPLVLAVALASTVNMAGCKGNTDQNAAQNAASPDTQNMSQDPADANTAPASDTSTSAPAASAPAAQPAQPAAAPAPTTAQTENASYESGPEEAGEQPVAQAPQPPPALPEYNQPPCPGEGYIWTPGYWGYQPTGYYWVPGAWTRAPYEGALWTPPYWGFNHGAYSLYPGYWGNHIGFYGGVNYGFGYVGVGYHGGYWNGGHFFYNSTVNNINRTVIHNVYNYKIVNRTTIINRVSYNGGPSGIHARPEAKELVAVREPRAPMMATQVQHREAARVDHAQFESVNHGRPEKPFVEHPIEADRDVHPAPRPAPHAEPHMPTAHAPEAHGRPEEKRPAHPEDKRPEHPDDKHK